MTQAAAATTNDLDALDLARVFHPNTNLAALHRGRPLVLARGKGVHVFDNHGKQYIEAMAGLWCTTLGYGDDELARTAYEQIKKLSFSHLFTGKSHEPGILLADKLVQMAPFAASRVFFGNSGSDANDTQIKLVWYYNNAIGRPKKKKIIARLEGLSRHDARLGRSHGLAVVSQAVRRAAAAVLAYRRAVYLSRRGGRRERGGLRDAPRAEPRAADLREGPDTVAAFIAEPLMGVGGVLLPPRSYFPKIQAVLAKHDVLLIDDEVITGFGRTGELWGAQAFGMRPQTVTAAKALSSAYLPISAVIVPEFLYAPMIEASGEVGLFGHGFTYSGHPVAAAVALRALGIYEERKLYEHVRADRSAVPSGARRRWPRIRLVGDTRGIGLVGACELVQNKATKAAFDAKLAVGAKCMQLCQEHGLIVRAIGDVIALCPPYIVTAAHIDEIFAKLRRGLDDTLEWAHREAVVAAMNASRVALLLAVVANIWGWVGARRRRQPWLASVSRRAEPLVAVRAVPDRARCAARAQRRERADERAVRRPRGAARARSRTARQGRPVDSGRRHAVESALADLDGRAACQLENGYFVWVCSFALLALAAFLAVPRTRR